MITFASVPLEPPNDGQELAEKWWHGPHVQEFTDPAYQQLDVQHLPIPTAPMRRPPRIGVLHWPTGADRFAVCHLVATGAQLTLLEAALPYAAPVPATLTIDDGYLPSISTTMWMLPPRPIAQRDDLQYYLLTLVDERWWWYQSGDEQGPEDPESWDDLITDLFAAVGVTPVLTAVAAAYGVPDPARWNLGPQPIPLMIEAACRQVGRRVVRLLDGTVRVVSYAVAQNDDDGRWAVIQNAPLAGGRVAVADIARAVPASVAVFPPGGTALTETLVGLAIPEYGTAGGCPDRAAKITCDGPVDGTYAAAAATDYYLWALSLTDCTLRGIRNVDPVALDWAVEWVHSPVGLVTRIMRPPWSDRNLYGSPRPVTGTGGGPEYLDECVNGTLLRFRATLTLGPDGLTQTDYLFDENLGVPCTGGISGSGLSGSGTVPPIPSPLPDPAGQTIPVVELACPVLGSVRTVAADYTVTWDDDIIHADATDGMFTITLPDPATGGQPGSDQFIIKKIDGTANVVTLVSVAGNIEFAGSFGLSTQGDSVTLYHDNGDWFVY